MSQFDYPRFHFSGKATINPGTANNNVLLPLVTYDPVRVAPVLPPRIYLEGDLLQLQQLGGLPVPAGQTTQSDESGLHYVAIEPIGTREAFHTWAQTPLGQCPLDSAYHELYTLVRTKRTQQPLSGQIPANWNFFGGMEFAFHDTTINSVTMLDEQERPLLLSAGTPAPPPDLAGWLGAAVDMNFDQGRSAAVMIDVLPTLALFSQVFCDVFRVRQGAQNLLKGRPRKASLRFLNLHRILHQEGVEAGSGTFFTAIPIADLEGGEQAELLKIFRKYGRDSRPLQGVFIRYNLFEVWENQMPDYKVLGANANPARATVVGSLSPWYAGELCSMPMGRLLTPEYPVFAHKTLAPFPCRVDERRRTVALDLLGSVPEALTQGPAGNHYETYPLGRLHLRLQAPGQAPLDVGTFELGPEAYSRAQVFQTSGILEIPWPAGIGAADFEAGELLVTGHSRAQAGDTPTEAVLWRESEFLITSDSAALYSDQGVPPEQGYRSYSAEREPCHIRVLRRGHPYEGALPMTVLELKVTQPGATAAVRTFLDTPAFRDDTPLLLPTGEAANAIYVFFPGRPEALPADLIPEILRSGFFINLRVLPTHDYGPFLDPKHPDYPTPVPFDVLYREVLAVYELVFPISSIITPFTEAYFQKGTKFLQQRMAPANWASATYMPSSRDMSEDQWALFCKWAESP